MISARQLLGLYYVCITALVGFGARPVSAEGVTSTFPCNDGFHAVVDPVRAGDVPAGATVVGLGNPRETLRLNAGSSYVGDIYLFNHAVLEISGGGPPTRLDGSVYLADRASLQINGANVVFPQAYGKRNQFYAADNSTVQILNSQLSHGELAHGFEVQILCGQARGTVRNSQFARVAASSAGVFVFDAAAYSIQGTSGTFEIAADNAGQLDVADLTEGGAAVYFVIRSRLPTPVTLAGGQRISGSVGLPSGKSGEVMSASVRNSDILYGLYLEPGADLTLKDSNVALLYNYHGQGRAAGVRSGRFSDEVIDPGDRKLRLVNTDVWVTNVYQDGPAGVLTIDNAQLGEHGCDGGEGAACILRNSVVDGSGGVLSARNRVDLRVESTNITAPVLATDKAVLRVRNSTVRPPDPAKGQPPVVIQAANESMLALESCLVDTAVAIQYSENGAVAVASFEPTPPGDLQGSVAIRGTANVLSASSSPNAFSSYDLVVRRMADGSDSVITHGNTPVQSGVLGEWDTSQLDNGDYTIRLVLRGRAGELATATRPVTLLRTTLDSLQPADQDAPPD